MRFGSLALTLLALAPAAALCDEAPPQGAWTGKGQVGFVASQGNTEAKSANAAIDLALLEDPWKHQFHFDGLYGQNAQITAAERWDARWESDYAFSKDFFAFGALRYERDLFSGFRYQGSATAGVGYQIFNTQDLKLTAQAGAGYRKLQPEELIKDASGAVISRIRGQATGEAIFTAGLDYSQALTSTTTLSNKFLLEAGSSNTLISDVLALTVKMSNRLALSVAYTLRDNTNPPPGLKNLDRTETVNLVFAF